jgi:hypothetical protein
MKFSRFYKMSGGHKKKIAKRTREHEYFLKRMLMLNNRKQILESTKPVSIKQRVNISDQVRSLEDQMLHCACKLAVIERWFSIYSPNTEL